MTESLLCPADEVSRLEMGRLMRFSQSVRLAVWTQIKLTHWLKLIDLWNECVPQQLRIDGYRGGVEREWDGDGEKKEN